MGPRLWIIGQLVFGPAAVAVYVGLELRTRGAGVAVAGACATFVVARVSVDLWTRRRLRLARRRLALLRSRRTAEPGRRAHR